MDDAPVLPASRPLFRDVHHRQIQHFQQTIVCRKYGLGLLPFLCHRKNLIRNATHCRVRDLQTVDILNVRFDVADGHALGVHGQDLFLNALADAGLVLFQHLRFKFALPILGNGNLNISKASTQGFTAVIVAAVVGVLVPVVVPTVAQFVIQLRIQTVLHEFRNSLLK